MTTDFNLFILWSNGRHKEQEILTDIREHFEILQTYEIKWSPKDFTKNLSRFYGKKLPNAYRKKRLCGQGEFLVICVNDHTPQIEDNKNINMTSAKYRYRQILGGNYLHASDDQIEAEENLLLLTGQSYQEFMLTPKPTPLEPITLHQNLTGTPSWESQEQLEAFIKKIPQIKLIASNIIETPCLKRTIRMLNARKKLLRFNRERYIIPIKNKSSEFLLKKAA